MYSGLIALFLTLQAPAHHEFLDLVNHLRAERGTQALLQDDNLSAWAAENNIEQQRLGLGHHVRPRDGQNRVVGSQVSAIGFRNARAAFEAFCGSGPHITILLDPNVTRIGYATDGWAWTANLR